MSFSLGSTMRLDFSERAPAPREATLPTDKELSIVRAYASERDTTSKKSLRLAQELYELTEYYIGLIPGTNGGPEGTDADGVTSSRRNRPGTRRADLWSWQTPPAESTEPLHRLVVPDFRLMTHGQPFAVGEYLEHLVRRDPSDVEAICMLPHGLGKQIWLNEHMRLLTIQIGEMFRALEGKQRFSVMCATEKYRFKCVMPGKQQPQDVPALTYMYHTLNGSTTALTSKKAFPNRRTIKKESIKIFSGLARRLYRFFAHLFFHQKQTFWEFEERVFLYRRFATLVRIFKFVPATSLVPEIPASVLSTPASMIRAKTAGAGAGSAGAAVGNGHHGGGTVE